MSKLAFSHGALGGARKERPPYARLRFCALRLNDEKGRLRRLPSSGNTVTKEKQLADAGKDQVEALEHYAKQRDDHEFAKWMSEIRLRAVAQIGKISRELEKAQGTRTELLATDGQKLSKEQQIEAAGLSVRTANRYEQLAAPEGEQLAPSNFPAILQ